MNDVKILFKRLRNDAFIPTYSHPSDAGCDLYAVEDVTLETGDIKLVSTGIAIQIPSNYIEAQIRPRSSVAIKHGVTVINSPGTVDPGYRGELKVGLINHGKKKFSIKRGDRIAQMIFSHIYKGHFIQIDELNKSDRNEGGFGSTGK